ncbi:hypothetical protein HG530_009069 [Fusarium avenaceum]|nr:hypothetical protein HG530_009069 [Fusarium avenaceum]
MSSPTETSPHDNLALFYVCDDLIVALVLLNKKVLEPLVLHLELVDLALQGRDLVGHLLSGFLKSLLALLLLDTEAGTGGSVAPSLVFLGSMAGGILKVQRSTAGTRTHLRIMLFG